MTHWKKREHARIDRTAERVVAVEDGELPPPKPVVFIAGPFRGPTPWAVEQNVRVAEETALEVWRGESGYALCPHTNTRHFDGAAPDAIWLAGTQELLFRADAVLLSTADWWASSGTRAEIDLARELGIPVFSLIEELEKWAAGQSAFDYDGRRING
jgi:hypothetical protein